MALLPPSFLDTVVAFETRMEVDGVEKFQAVATGALFGFQTEELGENNRPGLLTFIATSRHVVEDETSLWLKFNKGDQAAHYKVPLITNGKPLWRTHPPFDIAVFPVNANALRAQGAEFQVFEIPEETLTLAEMEEEGVAAGDGVFVVGFPLGIAGGARKYVVARGGFIARVDNDIVEEEGSFLIDCQVFPGNSGGPVILAPTPTAIEGTKPHHVALVIGVVSSYVPYRDTAVSTQTRRTRVIFEENSGLTAVVPIDAVIAAAGTLIQASGAPATVVRLDVAEADELAPGSETA